MALPLDAPTIDACRILADAVRRERVPDEAAFRRLERSLVVVITQKTDAALAAADGAFRALDGGVRATIAGTAIDLAQTVAEERRQAREAEAAAPPVLEVPVTEAPVPRGPRKPRPPGSLPALLSAVNRVRQPPAD
jgi:hypothetical protein